MLNSGRNGIVFQKDPQIAVGLRLQTLFAELVFQSDLCSSMIRLTCSKTTPKTTRAPHFLFL